jgi:cellulose synthase (UDP-forming)
VTVSGPSVVLRPDRDYLVLGTVTSQPAFRSLDSSLPATFDENGVHTRPARSYLTSVRAIEVALSHWQSKIMGQPTTEKLPTNETGIPDALIEEVESPSSPDRCIVLVMLKDDAAANSLANVFLDRSQSRDIAGSVSLFRHQKFESYQVEGQTFHVGDITWFAMMRIWLTQHFLLLLAVVSTLSFMVAYWTREWLSQRACERLKLSGSVYDTRLTVDRSES